MRRWGQNAKVLTNLKTLAQVGVFKNSCETAELYPKAKNTLGPGGKARKRMATDHHQKYEEVISDRTVMGFWESKNLCHTTWPSLKAV